MESIRCGGNLEKKECLCRYHNLEIKIEKKKAYIDFCNETASLITGQDFSVEKVDRTLLLKLHLLNGF